MARYGCAIMEFVVGVLEAPSGSTDVVILFGGLVRDGRGLPGWSDIDVIVVGDAPRTFIEERARRVSAAYGVRIDVECVGRDAIERMRECPRPTDSALLTAFSGGPDVARPILGAWTPIPRDEECDRSAALAYVRETLPQFERLLDCAALGVGEITSGRAVRWFFSLVRASLRARGAYVHPYRESLDVLARDHPEVDSTLGERLCLLRCSGIAENAGLDAATVAAIRCFIESHRAWLVGEV